MTVQTRTFAELIRIGALEVGDGYRAKNEELGGNGPIFLRGAYLQEAGFSVVSPDRFIEPDPTVFGGKVAVAGDVVVTTKGNSTGRVGRIRNSEVGAIYSPHLSYWRSREPEVIDQSFLYYWSRSPEFRRQLSAMSSSTDMAPYLSLRDQMRLQLSLPLIDEQREIGRMLSALDDKIDLNRRMNETLEAMARAIFKDWFVDFGPTCAKMEGRSPYLAPDLWALFPDRLDDEGRPEGWHRIALGEVVLELRRGISPSYVDSGGIRILNQKCIRDRQVVVGPSRRHDPSKRSVDGREIKAGDVLVNSTGVGTLGRTAQVWDVDETTVVDSHVTVVRGNTDRLSPYYLGLNLTGREAEIEALGEGSTSQTELARTRLAQLPLLQPSSAVQSIFDDIVRPFIACMLSNRRESQSLTTTRDLLLPKLMSGEVRVREAERAFEAAQ